ncbi:MAG: restriction endonuclease subunit S [Limisphaerales bacterium]
MSRLSPDWKCDRLKDVSAINAASLPADTDPDYEFDYLEISNVDYHGIVDPNAIERMRHEDAPSRARRRVANNCTVISSVRPNLQAVAFLDNGRNDFVCSTGFNVVQPAVHKLSPKFVYYALISEGARQYFEASAKGVGYPAVDDKDFNSFAVPLPPLPEQQRIAAYLDASCAAIDAAVATKRRQRETLDAVRDSLIESAVTKGIQPGVRCRQINEDWIGEIPEHWCVCKIKRVVSQVDYGISESSEPVGKFPVLKMGNIQSGEIVFSKIEFVEEVSEDLLLEKGDLLYNRTNSPDQVGKAAVFRDSNADGITFASYLVRLRTNHRADPYYLNYLLNSSGFLAFARRLAIPSVQQSNLNSTRYCRMLIPLPLRKEQEIICAHLDAKLGDMKKIVSAINQQITTLTAYRKSLIHECVTGQQRVGG